MKEFDVKSLKGLTQDSRVVKQGYLFAALQGNKFDGRDYIDDALRSGAVAILAPSGTELSKIPDVELSKIPDVELSSSDQAALLSTALHYVKYRGGGDGVRDVAILIDENPRKALAYMAAEFYGQQPERIVAVTGTNGKTSTVHFAEQIWRALGEKASSLGTLGVGSMTTPDPVSLHAELADLADYGVTHLAMEASSHGLDQYRLDGVDVKVAGFTNLSRDHLDYHETMDDYFAAKLRLFTEVLADDGVAVLNADDERYNILHNAAQGGDGAGAGENSKAGEVMSPSAADVRVLSYGRAGEDLKLIEAIPSAHGQDLKIEILGEKFEFTLPLVGDFQVMNVLCALGMVIAEFLEDKGKIAQAVAALKTLQGVPGRLQLVQGFEGSAAVYIDYAHTPDALETILKALRPHTSGQLVCLFGCGGDRDKGKRLIMGKIASEYADYAVVTDDNPRSENSEQIRQEILAASSDNLQEIAGRREAIAQTIKGLNAEDVVVIAGKGHEQGQIFADHTEEFDDYQEAEKVLKSLKEIKGEN